jgi:hypothetical protein
VLAHKTLWIALYSQSIMQAAFGEPGGLFEVLFWELFGVNLCSLFGVKLGHAGTGVALHNLAQQMASLPQTLYSTYSNLGRAEWTILTQPANTYGNSLPWIEAASTAMARQVQIRPQVFHRRVRFLPSPL